MPIRADESLSAFQATSPLSRHLRAGPDVVSL